MRLGSYELHLLSDGYFTLDPGAYYGIVPRPIWSRYAAEDAAGRVKLALRVPLLVGNEYSILVDSGIGKPQNQKLASIYEVDKSTDIGSAIENYTSRQNIRYIVHSHLHFDHSGHSLLESPQGRELPNATLVAQSSEFRAYWRPNEFTRSSYWRNDSVMKKSKKLQLEGSARIAPGIRAVKTGGHTSGHQVIIAGGEGKEMIYFGDLIPSAFHVRVPYVTAIDSFPLETIKMKRLLIRKAIRDGAICIFNHDPVTPSGILHGDVEKPQIEAVSID